MMISMPLKKISAKILERKARTHNLPPDLAKRELEDEIERGWQKMMAKAEKYVWGSHILENGGHFSAVSLGNWMEIANPAGLECVPVKLGGLINPVTIFALAMGHDTSRFTDELQEFPSGFQHIRDNEIVRFDGGVSSRMKSAMTLGRADGSTPPYRGWGKTDAGIVFPDMSDERVIRNVIETCVNTKTPVWIRPWVEPVMMSGCAEAGYNAGVMAEQRQDFEDGFPEGSGDLFACEWRVYVKNAEVVAVSNYAPAIERGQGDDAEIALCMAKIAVEKTREMIDTVVSVGAIPHHPMYEERDDLDPDAIHFSMDFLEVVDLDTPTGRSLLMLEGGPAHLRDPHWGAHPCCFGLETEPKGLALSLSDIRGKPWSVF